MASKEFKQVAYPRLQHCLFILVELMAVIRNVSLGMRHHQQDHWSGHWLWYWSVLFDWCSASSFIPSVSVLLLRTDVMHLIWVEIVVLKSAITFQSLPIDAIKTWIHHSAVLYRSSFQPLVFSTLGGSLQFCIPPRVTRHGGLICDGSDRPWWTLFDIARVLAVQIVFKILHPLYVNSWPTHYSDKAKHH